MAVFVLLLLLLLSFAEGKSDFSPQNIWQKTDTEFQNVIVPLNCLPGQQWINDECRDIWRSTVMNEDIKKFENSKILSSILNGLIMVRTKRQTVNDRKKDYFVPDNVNFRLPNQCYDGYKLDTHGVCREIFD